MDETAVKCQQMQLWFIPHYSAEPFCDQKHIWSLVCFWKYKWWVSVFTFEQKDSGLLNKRSTVTQRADLVYNDGGGGPKVAKQFLKTADGKKNYHKTGGRPRKEPRWLQCREAQSGNLWMTVEPDCRAAGIREETKRALESKKDKKREFPSISICSRNQEWLWATGFKKRRGREGEMEESQEAYLEDLSCMVT